MNKLQLTRMLREIRLFEYKELTRFGRKQDGGYVIPNDLFEQIDSVVSLGISFEWSFEMEIRKSFGDLEIYTFDYTTNVCKMVEFFCKEIARRVLGTRTSLGNAELLRLPISYLKFLKLFHHKKYRISTLKQSSRDFSLFEVMDLLNLTSHKSLLKVDIEGSEYEIIDDVCSLRSSFVIIVMEFHDILKNEELFLSSLRSLQEHFVVVHIHANNFSVEEESKVPTAWEFTFVERSYIENFERLQGVSFPRKGLDFPNDPDKPEFNFFLR